LMSHLPKPVRGVVQPHGNNDAKDLPAHDQDTSLLFPMKCATHPEGQIAGSELH
jgi:hypothetical protein